MLTHSMQPMSPEVKTERLLELSSYRFERILVESDVNVQFVQNPDCRKPSGLIQAPHFIDSALNIDFDSRTKRLHVKSSTRASLKDVTLHLSSVYVKEFELRGNGHLSIQDLNVSKVQLTVVGNGKITASGSCESVKKTLDGNGEINTVELINPKVTGSFIKGSGQIIEHPGQNMSIATVQGNGRIISTSGSHKRKKIEGYGAIQSIAAGALLASNQPQLLQAPAPNTSTEITERVDQLFESLNKEQDTASSDSAAKKNINFLSVFTLAMSVIALLAVNFEHVYNM